VQVGLLEVLATADLAVVLDHHATGLDIEPVQQVQ
jgi:hypothetical protein